MAGTNRVVKENEILFRLGEPAECMYIVRKGTLRVFIPKGADEEVPLAVLKDGAIVGEMAFFDNKPRSASVKAIAPTEITEITRADFDRLLTQVPKWVVTMMQSLSGRLRQTNERLQALEAASAPSTAGRDDGLLPRQTHPFQHVIRVLRLAVLLLSKDGQKDAGGVALALDRLEESWVIFFGEEKALLGRILEAAENAKFLTRRNDDHGRPLVVFPNRGTFTHFCEFFSQLATRMRPAQPFFSPAALALFQAAVQQAVSSGYETLNVNLRVLNVPGFGVRSDGWAEVLTELAPFPDLKTVKNGGDLCLRVQVKEHKQALAYLKTIQVFKDAGLA